MIQYQTQEIRYNIYLYKWLYEQKGDIWKTIFFQNIGPVVPIGTMGDWNNVWILGDIVPIGITGDWNNGVQPQFLLSVISFIKDIFLNK